MPILDILENARRSFQGHVFEQEGRKVFGVPSDLQPYLRFDELRVQIATEMCKDPKRDFIEIFGDAQPFTSEATEFALKTVSDIIFNQHPQAIIQFGFTGKYDPIKNATDTNYLISKLVDDGQLDANRVLGYAVDYHTPVAIKTFPGTRTSDNVKYLMLTYSNTPEPKVMFGGDIGLSHGLTNKLAICCDGGIQSLLQALKYLVHDIPVIAITQLRDPKESTNNRTYDVKIPSGVKDVPDTKGSGLPWMSAAGFLEYLQIKVQQAKANEQVVDFQVVQAWLEIDYFKTHKLTFMGAKNIDSKPPLWEETLNLLYKEKVWEKLDKLTIIKGPHAVLDNIFSQNNSNAIINNNMEMDSAPKHGL